MDSLDKKGEPIIAVFGDWMEWRTTKGESRSRHETKTRRGQGSHTKHTRQARASTNTGERMKTLNKRVSRL